MANMKQEREVSLFHGGSAAYLEDLYEQYLSAPETLEPTWRAYFDKLPKKGEGPDIPHGPVRAAFLERARQPNLRIQSASGVDIAHEHKQAKVIQLIQEYRLRGHLQAKLDPLGMHDVVRLPELELGYYGLSAADLDVEFDSGGLLVGRRSLREIEATLHRVYCSTVGAEYMHVMDATQKAWIQERLESRQSRLESSALRKRILSKLTAAEGLERYLHTKYVGQKRFSLEGGESLIPLMDELIQRATSNGVKEVVIGMAHRGRLNVLVNILGKQPQELFEEFEGKKVLPELSSGDVKYHQGFSSDVRTQDGFAHLTLAFNPSHLEIVAPVVQGSVRARQDRRGKSAFCVLPVSIHGDAAFTGQGVVMECFNMSQCPGYFTGGTVHIVCNNQIGFTTSNPSDARSSRYCTDVAKMVDAPVFHVNGDDPDAVIFVTQLALDYRQRFARDVVIDLVCYRRHGHNEADEPMITQPMMYRMIRSMKTTRQKYADTLVADEIISSEDAQQMVQSYRTALERGDKVVEDLFDGLQSDEYSVNWQPFFGTDWRVDDPKKTNVSDQALRSLAKDMLALPKDFVLQAQINKLHQDRGAMAAGERPMDWGFAENLAYASLLSAGISVRISGQDCGRGTFAHRHAVLHCQETGRREMPLQNLAKEAQFTVIDSVLSEEAVLGFEYGYSTAEPRQLVIWEAQFGDFANGAQVVIDQFISSGEQKWGRLCGLVMLLPHGYEGMGPEHSSARLERYLQLCAEHNMQICVPSTPAQAYHMLRRQALRPYRKPLIVMSPKSLLRHRLATSTFSQLTDGRFEPVLGEVDDLDPQQVKRVVLCSGKVYYDLLQARRSADLKHVAIVRVEQLYPFPEHELTQILATYPKQHEVIWCQEEPKNQGAWYCSQHHMRACLPEGASLGYAGRAAAASPAAGYLALHTRQQNQLVAEALELEQQSGSAHVH